MAFICDKCGKSFNDKSNFNRHLKTHTTGQTYSCSICQKQFNRPDNKRRHEESHNHKLTCDVCGQYFNDHSNLRRHLAMHDRPAPKPATKRPASPEPGPSGLQNAPKRKRPMSPPPCIPINQHDVLPEDPETREVFLNHWREIQTHSNIGNRLQDRYNFQITEFTPARIAEMVEEIFLHQTTAFRLNLSPGFILRNIETGELRYHHPSANNGRLLEIPPMIRNRQDLQRFLDEVDRSDLLEYARQQRENTKWVVHLICNLTFYVNKIIGHPIGAKVKLPDYVANNKAVVGLVAGSHGPYDDNLCFFRCLAVHRGAPVKDVETPAKTFFQQYLQHFEMSSSDFEGVELFDFPKLEKLYNINIFVYGLEETEDNEVIARLIHRSIELEEDTMYLNLYKDHFSYIKSLDHYTDSFACNKCDKLWKHVGHLHRHERTCTTNTQLKFPGGIYKPTANILQQLKDENIPVPIEFFPYRATYDIESMFIPTNKTSTKKLNWINEHVPVSISVCSNVPRFTDPVCLISEGDPYKLVSDCIKHLHSISHQAKLILSAEFAPVFDYIDEKIAEDLDPEDEKYDKKKKKHYLQKLAVRLEAYLRELPVIGFNTGKYDINVMKVPFFSHLANECMIKFTVKRNNNFMCVKTETLKFLDITNYLAPGFSYSQFLKAYECTEEKGHFPYEWMTSLDKLDSTQLPPHSAFYSKLKNCNISEEEYQLCINVWRNNNMRTMKDLLIWYNNKDVVPMLEAIDKMFKYYQNQKIDMFKDGISVPGLTLRYMFQDLPNYFTLIDKYNDDLYHLYKNNIVGGPSIIFHRYHEKDVTFIRPKEYDDPKPCKKLYGVDANALYLWSIMQDMPTGHFVRRRCENNFKREVNRRFERKAIEWLEWEAKQSGCHIQHHGNGMEKKIGMKRVPVDGYSKDTNTVFQFQGCIFHGHDCHLTQHMTVNPINKVTMKELFINTVKNCRHIRKHGYQLKEMWECEWDKLKKEDPELQQFVKSMKRPCDNVFKMVDSQIIQAVQQETLFGFVEVDIHVPDQLKPKFAEMPPIFKNTEISREDIGPFMKDYAEKHEVMKQPRKSLIGSMFGEKILLATPLLKWYLERGLVVTKVYQVVEYTPAKCFKEFGEQVSDARRAGDADPNKKIVAETKKLEGNSSYGTTVTNKEKHRNICYGTPREVSRCINDPFFRQCNQLDDETFEVELAKRTILLNLPLHIGCFVYQYAKLRMLQFYYDFMDVFVDRRDFQYCSMDTDSAYMALSADTLEEVIKPNLQQKYILEKKNWFPRTDTPEHTAYDKRTPGLFKTEFLGDGIVALYSKTYYCFGEEDKFSCKGVNKRNNDITKETYMNVLKNQISGSGVNRGFRSINNHMLTYEQVRDAFSYFYPKRKVLDDGVSTEPLDI